MILWYFLHEFPLYPVSFLIHGLGDGEERTSGYTRTVFSRCL